jgi:hypothetical protein
MRPLLPSARLAFRAGHAGVLLAASVVLVVATVPWQGGGFATSVVHLVVLLTALAVAVSFDDPTGDVATAAPVPRSTWTAARTVVTLERVLPVLVVGFLVAWLRFRPLPGWGLVAETTGHLVAALAVVAGLRAWRGTHLPSYPAGGGVLLVALVTRALPGGWAMVDPQPWGPPYEAALWRWLGLVLVALAVLAVAVRDPLDR